VGWGKNVKTIVQEMNLNLGMIYRMRMEFEGELKSEPKSKRHLCVFI